MKTILFATLIAAFACVAPAETRIAVADFEIVMKCHPKTEENTAYLATTKETFEEQMRTERNAIKKLQDTFMEFAAKAENEALSDSVRLAARNSARDSAVEIKRREEALKVKARELQNTLASTEMQLFQKSMVDIEAAIKAVAAEQKLDLILDSSAQRSIVPVPYVLFSSPALDVTEALVKAIKGDVAKVAEIREKEAAAKADFAAGKTTAGAADASDLPKKD